MPTIFYPQPLPDRDPIADPIPDPDNLAYSPARIPDSLGDPLAQPRADIIRLPARDADGYTLADRRAQHARSILAGDRDSAGIYASHVRAHPDHPSRRRSD